MQSPPSVCLCLKRKKGKEEYLYIAMYTVHIYAKRSDMDHTVYLHITPCLPFLRSIHWRSPPVRSTVADDQLPLTILIYRPRRDERLSWPGWLTCSGWLTHISGHPSAAGRVQNRESSPAKTDALTTEPRHHCSQYYAAPYTCRK